MCIPQQRFLGLPVLLDRVSASVSEAAIDGKVTLDDSLRIFGKMLVEVDRVPWAQMALLWGAMKLTLQLLAPELDYY